MFKYAILNLLLSKRMSMRPSTILFSFVFFIVLLNGLLGVVTSYRWGGMTQALLAKQQLVATLGLTDLSLSTEARYTRHPSLSDPLAAYMDHPGAIEHFPSGSFILPIANMDN